MEVVIRRSCEACDAKAVLEGLCRRCYGAKYRRDGKPDGLCGNLLCLRPVYLAGRCSPCYQGERLKRIRAEAPPVSDRDRMLEAVLEPSRPDPLAVARVVWERRLSERADHFRLDGRPVSYQALMQRTNAELKGMRLRVMTAFE